MSTAGSTRFLAEEVAAKRRKAKRSQPWIYGWAKVVAVEQVLAAAHEEPQAEKERTKLHGFGARLGVGDHTLVANNS